MCKSQYWLLPKYRDAPAAGAKVAHRLCLRYRLTSVSYGAIMILSQHPEYEKYVADRAFTEAVWVELALWVEEHEAESQQLKTAVSRLIALGKQYNQIMWQAFPFCRMCLGGCCVVGASEVTAMDAAALFVLEETLPELPQQTRHDERACIYLGDRGCTWPALWRPLKCMLFFSLGRGHWQLESSDKRYDELRQALQAVLDESLPKIMGDYLIDTDELAEPISFAATLAQRLAAQFLPPHLARENGRFPAHTDSRQPLLDIPMLTTQLLADPPDMCDQFLSDLEQLEWILAGHPANEDDLLAEINGRYAPHQHEHAAYWQLTRFIRQYQVAKTGEEAS